MEGWSRSALARALSCNGAMPELSELVIEPWMVVQRQLFFSGGRVLIVVLRDGAERCATQIVDLAQFAEAVTDVTSWITFPDHEK